MERLAAPGVWSATNAFAVADDGRTAYMHDPKADIVVAIDLASGVNGKRRTLKWDDKNFAHRRWVCYSLFSMTSGDSEYLSILFFNQHKKVFCLVHFLISGELLVKMQTNALNTSTINKERLAYSVSKDGQDMQVIFYERFTTSSSASSTLHSALSSSPAATAATPALLTRLRFVFCSFSCRTMRVTTKNGILPPGQWELPWLSSQALHFLSTASTPHLFISYPRDEQFSWEGTPPTPAGILATGDAYPPRKAVWCNAWSGGAGCFSVTEKAADSSTSSTEDDSGRVLTLSRRTTLWRVDVDSELRWKRQPGVLETPEYTKSLALRLVAAGPGGSLFGFLHADWQHAEAAIFRVQLDSPPDLRPMQRPSASSHRLLHHQETAIQMEGADESTSSDGGGAGEEGEEEEEEEEEEETEAGVLLRRSTHPGRYRPVSTCTAENGSSQGGSRPATGSSSEKNAHLLADLTCPICLDTYEDPRTLGCGHSMCWECVEQIRISVKSETIRCPSCRQPTTVPPSGLPVNYGLKDALAALSRVVMTRRGCVRCVACCERTEKAKMWVCITCARREQQVAQNEEQQPPPPRAASYRVRGASTVVRIVRRPASLHLSSSSTPSLPLSTDSPPSLSAPSSDSPLSPPLDDVTPTAQPRTPASRPVTLSSAGPSNSPNTPASSDARPRPLSSHSYCASCLLNNHAGHEYEAVERMKERSEELATKREESTRRAASLLESMRQKTTKAVEEVVTRTLSLHLSAKFDDIFDILAAGRVGGASFESDPEKADVDRRAELVLKRLAEIGSRYESRVADELRDLLEECKSDAPSTRHTSPSGPAPSSLLLRSPPTSPPVVDSAPSSPPSRSSQPVRDRGYATEL